MSRLSTTTHSIEALWREIEAAAHRYVSVVRDRSAGADESLEWDLPPPASKEAIAALEGTLGFVLPDDYRASLLVHDGFVLPEVPEERRMVGLSAAESVEAKKLLDGLLTSSDWHGVWRRELIPIVKTPAFTAVLDAASAKVFDLYVDELPEEALCVADASYVERLEAFRDALVRGASAPA
jgi:hypothetical protein